jgi:hypothetical protein
VRAQKPEAIMTDTAIVGENVEIVQTVAGATSPFSWSAAIAGAIAATAVSFVVISLGTGIGLSLASPYREGPSGTTLTLIAAVWLVMAQALGFACGGYMSARLRAHFNDSFGEETRFRDAAQGFLVWGIGVVLGLALAIWAGAATLGTAAQLATGAVVGTSAAISNPQNAASGSGSADTTGYFVDMLFRPGTPNATGGATSQATPGGTNPNAPTLAADVRAEVTRILARAVTQGGLSEDDRNYLAQLVSQRTGLPPDEARRRVTEVEIKAREAAKQAADAAAKAGAYLSFWTFMSLLFGAAAAVLGGIVGGELRDSWRSPLPAS